MPQFAERNDCVGCSACASICPVNCIKMLPDKDGFSYPVVSDSDQCLECNRCQQVCPVLSKQVSEKSLAYTNALESPTIKSKEVVSYAAKSRDISIRSQSSSGGIFTEIAKYVISQGGVVYGAAYDESFRVYHCCIKRETELSKIRGAKYAESSLMGIFTEITERLNMGQMVLFAGTSCQVAGLKSFAEHVFITQKKGTPEVFNNQLICLDFVCHGVPSPMAWQAYIDFQSGKDNNGIRPKFINLRDKTTGWSHYQYSAVFQYSETVRTSIKSINNPYMKLFIGDYISRLSCSHCLFKGYKRSSDITLGDYWGIWNIMPEMDDNKGTSVVLIQSSTGKQVWDEIKHNLIYQETGLEEASQENLSMIRSSLSQAKRDAVLNIIRENGFSAGFNEAMHQRLSILGRVKNILKRIK